MGRSISYKTLTIYSRSNPLVKLRVTENDFEVLEVYETKGTMRPFYKMNPEEITRRDFILFAYHQTYETSSMIDGTLHKLLETKQPSFWNEKRRSEGNKSDIMVKHLASMKEEYWKDFRRKRGVNWRNEFWVEYEGENLDYERDIKGHKFLGPFGYTNENPFWRKILESR